MKFVGAANFLIFFILSAIQILGQNIITFDNQGWSNDQVLPSNFSSDNYTFSSKINFFTNYGYNFNVNSNSLYYVFQDAGTDIITITNKFNALEEFKSVDAYQVSQTSTDTLVIEGWDGNTKLYTKSFTGIYSWQPLNLNYKNVNKIVIKISPPTSTQLTDYNFDNFTFIDTAMPVELTTFNASNEDGGIMLKWQTATEINNYGFEVQRAEIGGQRASEALIRGVWRTIGFIKGADNSSVPQNYSFVDKLVNDGSQYKYRLKQTDYNGNYIYSNVLEITATQTFKDYSLSQNYPNPFNPSTTISYQLSANSYVTLIVYDILGNLVETLIDKEQVAGKYSVRFPGMGGQKSRDSQIASGIYFYRLQATPIDGQAGNFVQTKKMLLLK